MLLDMEESTQNITTERILPALEEGQKDYLVQQVPILTFIKTEIIVRL